MGMDLSGAGGEFRWSSAEWEEVLAIAETCGWKAAGTQVPPDWSEGKWDGNYLANDGQIVTPQDALNLAEALERSLIGPAVSRLNKGWPLEEFIEFCRAGSFAIQ